MKLSTKSLSAVICTLITLMIYVPNNAMSNAADMDSQLSKENFKESRPSQNRTLLSLLTNTDESCISLSRGLIQEQDFHFANFKTIRPAHDILPLSSLPNISASFFHNFLWISESIAVTTSKTNQAKEEIGYVNFSYYNNPKKISTLIETGALSEADHDFDGYIFELFVKPSYRNLGLGSQLFDKAISTMKARTCQKIKWKARPFEESGSTIVPMRQEALNIFYSKRGGVPLLSKDHMFVYAPDKQ